MKQALDDQPVERPMAFHPAFGAPYGQSLIEEFKKQPPPQLVKGLSDAIDKYIQDQIEAELAQKGVTFQWKPTAHQVFAVDHAYGLDSSVVFKYTGPKDLKMSDVISVPSMGSGQLIVTSSTVYQPPDQYVYINAGGSFGAAPAPNPLPLTAGTVVVNFKDIETAVVSDFFKDKGEE
jgi:hypothetical protein